jgi:DNA oxidative demethylase
MRLKPTVAGRGGTLAIELEPRSVYVFAGAARSEWQHSIPPAKELRYSITFRTLRSRT